MNGGQTCFSPRCVSAEHSIYFTALILLANFWPCSRFNGDKPCSDKALNVSLSSLKSILVPILGTKATETIRRTRNKHVCPTKYEAKKWRFSIFGTSLANSPTKIIGASGQWCFISGYHFDVTFSNDDGLKTKHFLVDFCVRDDLAKHKHSSYLPCNTKADEKHVSLWIWQRSQSIVILLASSIPSWNERCLLESSVCFFA